MRMTYLTTGILALTLAAAVPAAAAPKTPATAQQAVKTDARLQGNWIVVKATGAFDETNIGTVYGFKGTTMSTTKDDSGPSGTFSSLNGRIVWKLSGMDIEMTYKYRFEGKNLLIEPENSGQTLILKKQ